MLNDAFYNEYLIVQLSVVVLGSFALYCLVCLVLQLFQKVYEWVNDAESGLFILNRITYKLWGFSTDTCYGSSYPYCPPKSWGLSDGEGILLLLLNFFVVLVVALTLCIPVIAITIFWIALAIGALFGTRKLVRLSKIVSKHIANTKIHN